MNEEVTVIIPVRDRHQLLDRTIRSVLGQSQRPKQVIVVDDGSKYPAEHALGSDIRDVVLCVRHVPGVNAAFARNRGIESANTQYVAFLDGDDWWLPSHLEKSIAAIQRQGVIAVFGAYRAVALGGLGWTRRPLRAPEPGQRAAEYLLCKSGSIRNSTIVCERWAAAATMYDEALGRHQDWDFAIRLEERGPIGYNAEATVCIDHGAPSRMSGRAEVASSQYFIGKHEARLTRSERVGFLLRVARHAVETGDGSATRAIMGMIRDPLTVRERMLKFAMSILAIHPWIPGVVVLCYRAGRKIVDLVGSKRDMREQS